MRKYISPGSWFSLEYPDSWREFEDTEDSFLFYNPDKWDGNFRISAYEGDSRNYAKESVAYELKRVRGSRQVEIGGWTCAYSVENFQEDGSWYTSHLWITGRDSVCVECSFVVPKGDSSGTAEKIIESLRIRCRGDRPWKEVIPVRVMEISVINEGYDWAVSTIKKQLTRDFTAGKADIANIQKVIDSGRINRGQRQAWESFGIAFGAILVNEMDGMDWVTVIDGKDEYPALRFSGTDVMVFPTRIVWDKVKDGSRCDLSAEYDRILEKVEAALN